MSKKIDYHKIQDLDFEEAMDQLNEIIQGLETGEVKLSESVDKFELGSELAKHCKKLLDDYIIFLKPQMTVLYGM